MGIAVAREPGVMDAVDLRADHPAGQGAEPEPQVRVGEDQEEERAGQHDRRVARAEGAEHEECRRRDE